MISIGSLSISNHGSLQKNLYCFEETSNIVPLDHVCVCGIQILQWKWISCESVGEGFGVCSSMLERFSTIVKETVWKDPGIHDFWRMRCK